MAASSPSKRKRINLTGIEVYCVVGREGVAFINPHPASFMFEATTTLIPPKLTVRGLLTTQPTIFSNTRSTLDAFADIGGDRPFVHWVHALRVILQMEGDGIYDIVLPACVFRSSMPTEKGFRPGWQKVVTSENGYDVTLWSYLQENTALVKIGQLNNQGMYDFVQDINVEEFNRFYAFQSANGFKETWRGGDFSDFKDADKRRSAREEEVRGLINLMKLHLIATQKPKQKQKQKQKQIEDKESEEESEDEETEVSEESEDESDPDWTPRREKYETRKASGAKREKL